MRIGIDLTWTLIFGKVLPGLAVPPPLPGGWHYPWTALNKVPQCLPEEKNTEAPA